MHTHIKAIFTYVLRSKKRTKVLLFYILTKSNSEKNQKKRFFFNKRLNIKVNFLSLPSKKKICYKK